ncbi:MAG: sulfotransferase [Planctomycetaceae bacterium]
MSSGNTAKPGFFLIGAPKGGTTAMAQYLSEHPNVFFSAPKELHFWNQDHEKDGRAHEVRTLEEYLRKFSAADPDVHRVVAEGSTTYFQSAVAVRKILEFNPQAKFLVMLRNPLEVAHGMHGELLRHFYEDVTDFEQAWRLQEERAVGRRLPRNPVFKHQLQFREVASFAPQLQRLFDAVPASQRLVILFDDFVKDTPDAYRRVLEFLELEDDGRTDFPKVHQAASHRFAALMRFYHTPPALFEKPIRLLRTKVRANSGRIKEILKMATSKKTPRAKLREEFAAELRIVFREDVARTSELLGRDLSYWTEPDRIATGDALPWSAANAALSETDP